MGGGVLYTDCYLINFNDRFVRSTGVTSRSHWTVKIIDLLGPRAQQVEAIKDAILGKWQCHELSKDTLTKTLFIEF